jgi:uncharacterized membrane protein
MTYVGGMIFLAGAVIPYARKLEPEARGKIISGIGKKFRLLSWVAVALLIITGFGMLGMSGQTSAIGNNAILMWKLILFALMIILSLVHDMVVGSRSAKDPKNVSLRTFSSWTGRITLLLALAIVYLAINLNLGI